MQVPKGKWQFCAIGLADNGQVLCTEGVVDVNDVFAITMKPEIVINGSYGLNTASRPDTDFLLSKLFIMHAPLPLYVQVPVSETKEIVFQTNSKHSLNFWGQGHTEDNKTAFVFNFGKIRDGRNRPSSLNGIVFEGEIRKPFDLKIIGRWHEGLSDTVNIGPYQKFMISNGEFSIGYKRQVGGLWCDFVSKYCNFSGAQKEILKISDGLRVNIWTQQMDEKALVQFFLIDDNGFHVKRFYDKDGNPLNFDAAVKQGTRISKGTPHPRDMAFAFEKLKLTGKETWSFSIPLGVLKDKWFSKSPFVEPSGRFFTMKVPADLTSYSVNYLAQLDEFSKKMITICGRRKQIDRTLLNLSIEGGTSASLSGKAYNTANHVLFRDFPIQRHSFPHEMAHNFRLNHGGLQELVVEVSRSATGFVIYGQESKWLFIDRMNDKKRNERWYPYTAIYLWGYSQGGTSFLRLLSRFEPDLFAEGAKKGFTKEEMTAAMFCAFLNRDMFEISSKYGLCSDRSRYKEALRLVRKRLYPY